MVSLFVDQKTIAQILQIDPRRVRQLEKDGIISKHETEGMYYIPDCVQAFYEYKLKPTGEVKYKDQQALHEKTKREMSELKLAVMRGELHYGADVEQCLTNMVITFRNRMLVIPSKMAPLLVGRRDQGEIEDLLDEEIRIALTSLANYDPGMFGGDENRDQDSRNVQENIPGSISTSPNKRKRMGRSKKNTI